ncbi:MAG: PspC domain-containing protein [Litorimonas sp.]
MSKRYRQKLHRNFDEGNWDSVDNNTEYFGESKRLRRNKIDGVIGGVCSGFGDYFGIDHTVMRILFVILVLVLGFPLLAYFILWIFIPSDKRAPYRREYYEMRKARTKTPSGHKSYSDAQDVNQAPMRATKFRDVKSKFRSLETRMQDLERSVTSKEWKLRRDFRDLEG